MSGAHATLETFLAHLAEARIIPDALRTHAKSCPVCAERLRSAERLFGAADVASLSTPSPELVARTWDRIAHARALDAAARALGHAGELIDRVVARLAGDTMTPTPALRGSTTATPRVLVYETPDVGISLSLGEPGADGIHVKGQVMPRREDVLPEGGRALVGVRAELREAPIGELGEFDLGVLPAETLHLVFTLGSMRIELPPVSPGGAS